MQLLTNVRGFITYLNTADQPISTVFQAVWRLQDSMPCQPVLSATPGHGRAVDTRPLLAGVGRRM